MSPSIPVLPQETVEQIIDCLYDDRPSLLTCSLASQNFILACRYHLFSEVVLRPSELDVFLRLLDNPYSTVATSISRIVVSGTFSSKGCSPRRKLSNSNSNSSVDQDHVGYTAKDFERLRASLRRVTFVRFTNTSLDDVPQPFWYLLRDLKSVKTVEVHRVVLCSPAWFFRWVSALPLLRTLTVSLLTSVTHSPRYDVDLANESESMTLFQLSKHFSSNDPLRMPLLDIRRPSACLPMLYDHLDNQSASNDGKAYACAGVGILEWLLAQCVVPVAQTLKMNLDCERGMVRAVRRYLEVAGSGVRELCLTIPSSMTALRNMPSIDFSPLTHIETLHLDGLLISHQSNTRTLETFFRKFFAQVFSTPSSFSPSASSPTPTPTPTSPPLRKITISLTVDTETHTHAFFGIPDCALLQAFTWCALPSILEEASLCPCYSGSRSGSGVHHDFGSGSGIHFGSGSGSGTDQRPALDKLHVELRLRAPGIVQTHWKTTEEHVRAGVWRGFARRGRLDVGFWASV